MSDSVRTVRLHGVLAKKFGRVFRLAVNSPAEAMRALCAQLPGFERFMMNAKDNGLTFAVFAGRRNLVRDQLTHPVGDQDIRIVPMVLGAKAGFIQTIIGAVLVVVGILISPFAPTLGAALISAGIGMVIGGITQMLSPQPKTPKKDTELPNYSFNGPENTQAQGNPVPLLSGRLIVGSAVISAGIVDKTDIYIPVDPGSFGGSGYGGGGTLGAPSGSVLGGCVVVDSWLPTGVMARSVAPGDTLDLADGVTLDPATGEVTDATESVQTCYRIVTTNNVSLVCSDTAPIPVRSGGYRYPDELMGEEVPTMIAGVADWAFVAGIEGVGLQRVKNISVGDRCFWAGEKQGSYILHHNIKPIDIGFLGV